MAARNSYLVVVKLHRESNLVAVVPQLKELLKDCSNGKTEQAFRSSDGRLMGWVMNSNLVADQIKVEFEGSMHTTNRDHVLVLQIGADTGGTQEFSRVKTWLHHHG